MRLVVAGVHRPKLELPYRGGTAIERTRVGGVDWRWWEANLYAVDRGGRQCDLARSGRDPLHAMW